jgi:hypothetical protein
MQALLVVPQQTKVVQQKVFTPTPFPGRLAQQAEQLPQELALVRQILWQSLRDMTPQLPSSAKLSMLRVALIIIPTPLLVARR